MAFTLVDSGNLTSGEEVMLYSESVSGGTVYLVASRGPAGSGQGITGVAATFVASGAASPTRHLGITNAKSDAGVPLTATATAGAMGITRTAGTSLQLNGEATSASAVTDKAMWEFNLPDSYVAGANIPVLVNCATTGSGTLTGASTTITVNAYTEVNGVETALTVSAAQQFNATQGTLTFTITGTGLVAGTAIALEIVMLVTSSLGANTGHVYSVGYQA